MEMENLLKNIRKLKIISSGKIQLELLAKEERGCQDIGLLGSEISEKDQKNLGLVKQNKDLLHTANSISTRVTEKEKMAKELIEQKNALEKKIETLNSVNMNHKLENEELKQVINKGNDSQIFSLISAIKKKIFLNSYF